MQKYYQNEYKFSVVYSRSNLSKIKDGAFYVTDNNAAYFDSFGVNIFHNKNIFRIQAFDSIISRYFCILLIVIRVYYFFSLSKYEKSDKIILKYFQ